jgi:hypothetical protein
MQTQLIETATALSLAAQITAPPPTATSAATAEAPTATVVATATPLPAAVTRIPSSTPAPSVYPSVTPSDPTFVANGLTYSLADEREIGAYTVRWWHRDTAGLCWLGLGTIERAGQPPVMIEDACPFVELPASDVTGEGEPDVLFQIRPGGGSHCCWGLVLVNLGAAPTEVLRIVSRPYVYDGGGAFEDLNGDGRFEFVNQVGYGFNTLPCSGPTVTAIAQYDQATRTYVGASPQYAGYYATDIDNAIRTAEASVSQSEANNQCVVAQMVALLMFSGQVERARTEFNRFYLKPDAEEFRANLEAAIRQSRFFVEAP